ncbi:metallophosphoesterase [Deltaproteobacteria bacterium TL4]
MSSQSVSKGAAFINRFKHFCHQLLEDPFVELKNEIFLKGQKVGILHNELPICLQLGKNGQEFHICPEKPLSGCPVDPPFTYLIIESKAPSTGICNFFRMVPGESVLLGKPEDPISVFNTSIVYTHQHVRLSYKKEGLVFQDLHSPTGTYLSPVLEQKIIENMENRRRKRLSLVKKIYGGTLEILPPEPAFRLLKEVNQIMAVEVFRPLNTDNHPGGMLEFPENLHPIIIGDLHAQVDNLLKILSENSFLACLEQKKAYMLFLGDLVHSEVDGQLEEMETSLLMMDLLFKLKVRFPQNVFILRGNHDSLLRDNYKSGVHQGALWVKEVTERRGESYCKEMKRFYRQLAYVAISKDFFACHASPPFRKVTRDRLINIHQNPKLKRELILNRLMRNNVVTGYTQTNVKNFRKALDLSPEIPFIVSHNPLSQDKSVWLNAGKIRNHHIVFSGRTEELSLFTRIGNKMVPFTYRAEPLVTLLNELPTPLNIE